SEIDLQLRIRNPAGEWRWMQTQGIVTLRDADGRALRVTGTHADITERLQQQRDILRANERLDLALQGSRLAIWDVDVTTGRVYLSEGWAEMLGDTQQETYTDTASLLELAHPDDRERIQDMSLAALKGVTPEYHVEHRVQTRSGTWKWILSHGRVTQRNARGRALRVTGTNADISARKEIERIKDEFITVVSHELRTPLSSIVGSLGLLAKVADPNEQTQTLLRVARDNSHRLVRLINDILDVEKLASDTLQIGIEPVDLDALLRSAIEANRGFADQFGVTLTLAHCEEPTWVSANYDKVMQVMANLLSNAVKFSPRGASVQVRVERIRDIARVSVIDSGPGIPEDFKPRVFDRFAQADSSMSRQRGGTGLGLAICKMIIDRLGGRIGFVSTRGAGATFYFDLQAQAQATSQRTERRRTLRAR
ncbi:MAG: PAS domain-containing sensor histidine kinase, partial [Pseudomonadota bacterium]